MVVAVVVEAPHSVGDEPDNGVVRVAIEVKRIIEVERLDAFVEIAANQCGEIVACITVDDVVHGTLQRGNNYSTSI